MDPCYANYMQDESNQIPWSSSPHAGVHTFEATHVDQPATDMQAVGACISPPPPTFISGIGHSSDGGPSRSSRSNKGKKPSGKTERTKWTAEEDEVLVSAWLNVSQDPIVGKDQSSDSYWSRIAEYFNTNKKEHMQARSNKGMVNHWTLINECVSKYAGFLSQTDGLHSSGTTEHDRMAHAARMYQDIEGKPFAFYHCWVVLANHPKWVAHMGNKKQKTVREAPNDIPVDLSSQGSSNVAVRPTGQEAAKAARKHGSASSTSHATSSVGLYMEQFEKLNQTKDAMVELKRKQLAMMRNAEDERIINIDVNSCTGLLRDYYQKRQEDIMQRLKSRLSSG